MVSDFGHLSRKLCLFVVTYKEVVLAKEPDGKNVSLEYDDVQPGVSADEQRSGIARVLQIIAGVLLVGAGIAMLVLPGQGLLTILVGLNLIKPDNFMVKWLRRKLPGVPEDGAVPKSYLIVGGLFFVASLVVSLIWGPDIFNWFKSLF